MSTTENKSNKPTHYAKIRHGDGRNTSFEQIGAAWINEKGQIFVRLAGKQIIDEPFTLFPVTGETDD